MDQSRFIFNGGVLGEVYPPLDPGPILALQRPKHQSEIDAIFCPATYVFSVDSLNITGSFELNYDGEFYLVDLNIGAIHPLQENLTRINERLTTKDFYRKVAIAAQEAGRTRALWYPPNTQVPDSSGSFAKAGEYGFLKHLPEPPSGGRGKSRKFIDKDGTRHARVWNDPTEIQLTVDLMNEAERKYRSSNHKEQKLDLSTKAKREQWVADASNIWSVGTVHVQLAIARKEGLIKSGRTKK
jgi:hypothetical protein